MSTSELFLIMWATVATLAGFYYHHEYWIARKIAMATLSKIRHMLEHENSYRAMQQVYLESGLSDQD